ncbi:YfhO family protein [Pseudoramibacter alactolyticus]|uniref:YfhO family protein n=1 Tax=Pseudoramibacter alactolyticus TaxID=113287 RepID=UPI00248E9DF9|nr:YfhO family protein [Pseudoramibacter alactolyticus]
MICSKASNRFFGSKSFKIFFMGGTPLGFHWIMGDYSTAKLEIWLTGCVAVCAGLQRKILMKTYHVDTVRIYHQYVQSSSRQIRALKTYDRGSFYRIGETSTRRMRESRAGTTANYNEAFVNAYASNAGYSSTNDGNVVDFYDRAGYKEWAKAMNAVNDPVVPIDALTGTKYVLSSYPIKGFKRVEGVGRYNHKTVYQNPYVFPFAFSYRPVQKIKRQAAANPFGYQNKIISSASGIEAEYYMPAVYHAETRKTIKKVLKRFIRLRFLKMVCFTFIFHGKKKITVFKSI